MVARYDKVIIRKVDIVDFDTAAGKQLSDEFGKNGIPYVRVYDGQGTFVGDTHTDAAAIESYVKKALGM